YPDAFSRVREVDPDYAIPGGESRGQFHERVRSGFEALAAEHRGKTVVVVTHGGVLATFYRHVNGLELRMPHRIPITNASYNVLAFDGERWSIETWNDTAHLEGAEPFEEA
ncbi:MAG TPA: histidine phosphatase family protein, partial [Usitatibacter sp.]